MKKTRISAKLAELEEITKDLESGDIDLEDGLLKFKKGLKIAKELNKDLKAFENQIIEIKKDFEKLDLLEYEI